MAFYDWFPILEGKLMTYHQYFAVVGGGVAFLISLIFFGLSSLMLRIANKIPSPPSQTNSSQKPLSQIELMNMSLSQQSLDSYNNSKPLSYSQNVCCDDQTKKTLQKLSEIFYKFAFFWLTLVPIVFGAVGAIYTLTSIIYTFAITGYFVFQNDMKKNPSLEKPQRNSSSTNNYSSKSKRIIRKSMKSALIKALAYSLIVPLFFHNSCVSFFNNSIGWYSSWLGIVVNTQLTRYFQIDKACPPGPPCHVFATVPEDTATSLFFNVQTNKQVKNNVILHYDELLYWNATKATRNQVQSSAFELSFVDSHGERNQHTALVSNLKPNTKYFFRVFYNNQYQSEHIYKTLPDRNSNETITMINSGDSGHTDVVKILNDGVAKQNPDIWFLGGDLAYDDNFDACYYTWDIYLNDFQRIFKQIGYMFPLVLTVGNHDVGLNELPGINITVSNAGPQYHSYFPQHYDRDPIDFSVIKRVPFVEQRRTVFYHEVGNMVYMSLDSGYLQTFEGWQQHYMENVFKEHKGWLKFVNYHVPIYSICGHVDHDMSPIVNALFHWVPVFDKYRVAGSFENHVHTFQRTKPLFGNMVSENGTTYFGDGAFGAIPGQACAVNHNIDIFASMGKFNNYWVSKVHPGKYIEHYAYDNNNEVADFFNQTNYEYFVDL